MSKNAIGLAVLFLSLIGVDVSESQIVEVASAIGTVVSFGLLLVNQLQREDVTLFFWKRNKVE